MDNILKLVMFAREHQELELPDKFASRIPPNYEGKYEQAIEASKVNYIKFLSTHLNLSNDEVITSYKFAKKFKCLTMPRSYQKVAKQILKENKRSAVNN